MIQGNVRSGKYPFGEISSGNCPSGNYPSRKCPSGKCLRGTARRGNVRRGNVRRGNVRWGTILEPFNGHDFVKERNYDKVNFFSIGLETIMRKQLRNTSRMFF